jgi:hypothetical protein
LTDPVEGAGTPQPNWVVRGGQATPERLQRGTAEHLAVSGLFGFSVQYQPGQSVAALAAAGRFPNAQISVSTDERLFAAGREAGYDVHVVKSPGRGFHHTVEVPFPLPDALAEALSLAFTAMPNPAEMP